MQSSAISDQPSAIRRFIAKLRPMADGRWLMALFGMPEYRRYVDHQRTHHPGCPVMSEREFVRAELERKYAGGGARCC